MDIIVADFETFYAKDYSLSKMSTQQYLDDARYETIGVAVKVNNEKTQWFSGTHEETKEFLSGFHWADSLAVAHNTLFDASILAWKYNIRPKMLADTLSMGRAIHGTEVGGSLKALAEHYQLGVKGTEVLDALGKRRLDFSEEELDRYGAYCVNDVELTYKLFKKLAPKFGSVEAKLIDMTLRMHTEPKLVLNLEVLEDHLYRVKKRKEELLEAAGIAKEDLMSNPKFAEILKQFNIEPPMKISLTTGKETFAFAKTDQAMKDLIEHDNPDVQAIVAARVGTKSTLEETRTQRFIDLCQTRYQLPVPLKYYGAMTGRWAATDKTNLQNIPRGSRLKDAIQAPKGCQIVGADLSNIELRVGLYFAGQMDKLQLLSSGVDLYKDFASSVFNVGYSAVDDEQRFIGKTCIAHGTPVLCDSGWKPIQKVTINDKIWDGEEWVCHQGLQSNGYKETLSLCGSWLTPDHLVWSGTQWWESQSVALDSNILSQALDIGAANLPLQATYKAPEEVSLLSSCSVTAGALSTLWTNIISRISKVRGAISALGKRARLSGIGPMLKPSLMTSIEDAYSAGLLRPLPAAIALRTHGIKITEVEEYLSAVNGEPTKRPSLHTYSLWTAGIIQRLKWTVSTTAAATLRVTYDSPPDPIMLETSALLANCRKKYLVYDLLSAGPRSRFTILTNGGPLIVHNCSLSLIYGTGHKKLRTAIKTMSGKDIGEAEAKRIVGIYRSDYSNVKASWYQGEKVLEAIRDNAQMWFGLNADLTLAVRGDEGLLLPSGIHLRYPDLKQSENPEGRKEWSYAQRKERIGIHGAKCYQNTIQALARCVMGESMVRIAKKGPIALTIHDAVYCVVPDAFVDKAKRLLVTELKREPEWAPGLPLDAEVGAGKTLAFKMKKLEGV